MRISPVESLWALSGLLILWAQEDEQGCSREIEGLEALGTSRKNCLGWPGLAWGNASRELRCSEQHRGTGV